MFDNSAGRKRMIGIYKRRMKPVQVGDMIYESIACAAKILEVSPTTIRNYIRLKIPLRGMICIYVKKINR